MPLETEERRKKGIFGWLVVAVFWLVQIKAALMLRQILLEDPAMSYFGPGLEIMMLIVIWALASLALGLLMYLTRGRKVIIRRQVS